MKVVILTGAGSHFCAGEDVQRTPVETFGLEKGKRLPQSQRIRGITRNLDGDFMLADKTVIAAVRGAALGLGFKLALSCDLIVAAEGATFGRPQTRIGLGGFDMFLPVVLLRLGIDRGYEAIITGRTLTAEELDSWGVLASVVADGWLRGRSAALRQGGGQPLNGWLDDRPEGHSDVLDHDGPSGVERVLPRWATRSLRTWYGADDEANLFKERARTDSASGALKAVYQTVGGPRIRVESARPGARCSGGPRTGV